MQLVGLKKNKYFLPLKLNPSLNTFVYNLGNPKLSYFSKLAPKFENNCESLSSWNSILIKLLFL